MMDRPGLTPELARAVSRLAQLRDELKQRETEEAALRDAILASIQGWPDEWFPIRIAGHELRRARRAGRLDGEKAQDRLAARGLLARVPLAPRIKDAQAAIEFPERVRRLNLDDAVTRELTLGFREAVSLEPSISADLLKAWRDNGTLPESDYRQCFKDGRSEILVLLVR
jgi:hypothetical protein